MCFDPVSLSLMAAATAAQAGGARLNQIASNKAIKAQVAAEQGRQKVYQQQADQQFQSSLDRFRPENNAQQVQDATNQRTQAIEGNISAADPSTQYQAVTSDSPEVVKSALAKSLANAVSQSKQQAQRLAKLGATDAVTFDNALDLGNTGMKLDTISNFSSGSKKVNMAEQAAAAQKRSGWGDALGILGQGLNIGAGLDSVDSGPLAATFKKTDLPWRNTMFGYDMGGKVAGAPGWINIF